MHFEAPLQRDEAERLRTAVYRFAELKSAEPPGVELDGGPEAVRGRVAFWSDEAAREFRSFWASFRRDQPSFEGFRDI